MGSHAADQQTATAASSGAQAQDQQLAANAAKNQQFSDQTRKSMFGTYDPTTGKYTGGTTSQFLDPNSLNQTGLNSTYLNQYNTAANTVANNTRNAVGTTMQSLNSRGMGRTPAGFGADQVRKAYQDQAGQLGSLYSDTATQQHNDALDSYWKATNMLNANASQTANLSVQGNQAAAGNYSSLYGTGEQQVQSPWGSVLGAAAGVGSAAITKYCWVAAELYGGWDDPRTDLVRSWIFGPFAEKRIGRMFGALYARFGERVAEMIRTNRPLRAAMRYIFDCALAAAVRRVEGAL